LQLARLQLGQVEDVVDDAHQRDAAGLYGACEPRLLFVEMGVEQQARDPQDAVQRRADLVAHAGEERALGEQRLFHFGERLREGVAPACAGGAVHVLSLDHARAWAVGTGCFALARHHFLPESSALIAFTWASASAVRPGFDCNSCVVGSARNDRSLTVAFAREGAARTG